MSFHSFAETRIRIRTPMKVILLSDAVWSKVAPVMNAPTMANSMGSNRMHNTRRRILIAIAGLSLAGCAGVPAERFESPQLSLTSFRMLPSDGVARRFFIGMRVTNPNRTPLNVGDLSYEVAFEGQPFLAGIARNLARIPPHAESEIEIQTGPAQQSDPRLLDRLLDEPRRERLQFDLRATLGLGGVHPSLVLQESGDLRLSPATRQ